jgi:putative membrane protein
MMMGFGFLGMLLFWTALLALVVGSVVWVFRHATGTRSSGDQRQPTARQVLDERFARGEISREEYEVVRARLEG